MTLKTAKIRGDAHSETWQLITETAAPLPPEKMPSSIVTNSGEPNDLHAKYGYLIKLCPA